MSAAALLVELDDLGVKLWVEGDGLRYKPRSAVDPELRERLAAHKAELLRKLQAETARTRIHQSRVLGRGPYKVEIVEITSLDPPGSARWERRFRTGAVSLVTDTTRNHGLALLWVQALENPDSDSPGAER